MAWIAAIASRSASSWASICASREPCHTLDVGGCSARRWTQRSASCNVGALPPEPSASRFAGLALEARLRDLIAGERERSSPDPLVRLSSKTLVLAISRAAGSSGSMAATDCTPSPDNTALVRVPGCATMFTSKFEFISMTQMDFRVSKD